MRKTLFVLLACMALYLVSYPIEYFSDGFLITNISAIPEHTMSWKLRSPTEQENAHIDSILNQKFTYMAKGCQSYVFLSEDQRYVIKFIKYQRFKTKPWLDLLAIFSNSAEAYRNERLAYKANKLNHLLTGWQLAYNELTNETGVLYAHLNTGDNEHRIDLSITDKLGLTYTIPLNEYQYLIQKKVSMLEPQLKQYASTGQPDKVKELVDRVLGMIQAMNDRGFVDHDPLIVQNTGVDGDQPVIVDVGQIARGKLSYDEIVSKAHMFERYFFATETQRHRE